MGSDLANKEAVLLISDHLSWDEEASHTELLERKISSYIDFINSGQIYEKLPQASKFPVNIKLVCAHVLTPSAERMLITVAAQLKEIGIRFSHEYIPKS